MLVDLPQVSEIRGRHSSLLLLGQTSRIRNMVFLSFDKETRLSITNATIRTVHESVVAS